MALCPFAEHKILADAATQRRIIPRAIIAHSAGGEAELYGWWQSDASHGLESHFWIGRDGRTVQYVDTETRADANGEANGYAISIETASTVHASEPWDPKQAAALIRLMDWLCDTHSIPRVLMDDPQGAGIAWHVQFGAPGPWTQVRGKVCPGRARIVQLQEVIIPAVARLGSPPDTGGFLPMLSDAEQKELLAKVRENHMRLIELQAEVVATRDAKGDSRMDRIAAAVGKLK